MTHALRFHVLTLPNVPWPEVERRFRHIEELGYHPTVVTGSGASVGRWTPHDASLAADVPAQTPVIRIPGPEPAARSGWAGRTERWLRRRPAWDRWWVAGVIDAARGVRDVDVVYADVWAPLGSATTTWASRVAMLAPYRVDMRLLELTGNAEVRFMHPLPALHDRESALAESLGEALAQGGAASADQVDAALEVTDEVFESAHSIVFDQAENRMHTVEAVLVATLGS